MTKRKTVKYFDKVSDPFNPQNKLSGKIDRMAYHTLYITEVNGVPCSQEIACTPKLKYPFDLEYEWHFPTNIGEMVSYEKYDGTNILQFIYKDENNKSFISYKTRGMMFVNMETEFFPLLCEMIEKYPEMVTLPYDNGCNISYELYGYLNHHLIIYDEPIELKLLFGVNSNHMIIPANSIFTFGLGGSPPKAEQISGIVNPEWTEVDWTKYDDYYDTLMKHYNDERKMFESKLTKDTHGQLRGKEGAVWYINVYSKEPYWTMFKLKPPTIEEIHWGEAMAERIGKNAILTTIRNATEDIYPVTFEYVFDLLLEEFTEQDVYKFRKYIDWGIENINNQKMFEREVIQYFKEHKLDGKSKGEVLRYFAPDWGSRNTTKIYHVLRKFGLVKESTKNET